MPLHPSKRKILMIAPTSFFSDYGGHIRIYEETLALQRLNNQIIIVTYNKGQDIPGFDIRRTAPLPYYAKYEVGSSLHKITFDIYLALKSLWVALRERPDLIHGHMHEGALIGGVIAKLLGIPLLFDYQGSMTAEMVDHGFLNPQKFAFKLVWRVEKVINCMADVILTSSAHAQRQLQKTFGIAPEKICPLPDCVDLDRFKPGSATAEEKQAIRSQFAIQEGRPVVVYLGLLADYQGIPDLLQAAAKLKEAGQTCHFFIMGFPNVPYYATMAAQLGVLDCVSLPGKIPYDEAAKWLSIGDLAISAKVSATEGSGKLLNYMALGLPVVAYDTAVHREYLGEWGIYAPAQDVDALAKKIGEAVKNPAQCRELGRQLRHRVESHYSWRYAAEQIDAIYAMLLN